MVDAQLVYALGASGASEEYVTAVMAGDPDGARNHPREYARRCRETGEDVLRPDARMPGLRALWDGDVARAYREGDANLAIVLETAFDAETLGLPTTTATPADYEVAL